MSGTEISERKHGHLATEPSQVRSHLEPLWQRIRSQGVLIPLAVIGYMVIWGASGLPHWNITDFDAFFLPSARIALSGHPFEIYRVRYLTVYPNANGPLSILPLTLVAALAQRLHWLNDPSLRRMLIMGVFAVFPLLLGREVLLATDRLRARPLAGRWRIFAWALVVLSPELWHAVMLYGHIEIPIMLWLTLAAVRALVNRHTLLAGVLLGLALLTRSMAVLYLLPLVLVLLTRRRWLDGARVALIAGLVAGLGLLPFWLADRSDTLYSLVTFRTNLIVGGGSIWGLLLGTPLQGVGLRYDSIVTIGAAAVLTLITLRMRADLDVTSRDIYLLLALSGLCFPFFIKTLWPYYFLDPYVWFAAWWLAGGRALPGRQGWMLWMAGLLLPASAVGAAQIAEQGVSISVNGVWLPQWSAAVCGVLLFMLAATAVLLWCGGRCRFLRGRYDNAEATVEYNTAESAPRS